MSVFSRASSSDSVYVIAEIGINHNGDLGLAKKMIDAAVEAGASCVKFQNFRVLDYISVHAERAAYQKSGGVGAERTQRDIIGDAQPDEAMTLAFMNYAKEKGIDFLSTPFESASLELLNRIGLDTFKISSDNLTNHPFLKEIAALGRPVILSTGMGTLADVYEAWSIFQGKCDVMLMQCTSNYPAPTEAANVRVLESYRDTFNAPLGFSDHTTNNAAAAAAVAMGATCVEKHFTISRDLPGIDQAASIEPHELKELVEFLEHVRSSLGSKIKTIQAAESDTVRSLRRSIVAKRAISAGEVFSTDNLTIKRPGTGLSPKLLEDLLGMRAPVSIDADEILTRTHLTGGN